MDDEAHLEADLAVAAERIQAARRRAARAHRRAALLHTHLAVLHQRLRSPVRARDELEKALIYLKTAQQESGTAADDSKPGSQ
jgi:hypothetical protein